MSKPKDKWWGYVKNMIRSYPYIKGKPVQGVLLKEREAVEAALEETGKLLDGEERLKVVDLVFFRKTNTLEGAALAVPCSDRTARRWHADFIRCVARKYGLIE